MTDWAKSGRRDSFSFHLVDPFTLQETGETIDVVAGESNITWGWYTDNKYSGTIKALNSTNRDRLIRIKQAISVDGEDRSLTLGTFFVENSGASARYRKVERSMNIYSTMWRYTQDVMVSDFYRPVGYNVVREIRELVEAKGGLLLVGDGVDEGRTHTRNIWFELGESCSTVLFTIAGWIGCRAGVDADGHITLDAAVPPKDKAVAYTFEAGRNCVYVPGVEMSDTKEDAVNRVMAWFSRSSKSDGDPYPLTDSAFVDLPETHPFSYARIGRNRSYVMRLSEPCSHEELLSQAQAYLDENCGSIQYYEIEHPSVPDIKTGDVVRYINTTDFEEDIDETCLVTEISMELKPGAPCKTKLKVVER